MSKVKRVLYSQTIGLALTVAFVAWVARHYPERITLGGAHVLYLVPGCR